MLLAGLIALALLPLTSPPTDSDELDVQAAREGLARLADAYVDWPAARPLECPLLGREVINDALTTAGIDSPLRAWDFAATSDDIVAVECIGRFTGAEGDHSNPETTVTLGVGDFGTPEAVDEQLDNVMWEREEAIPLAGIGGSSVGMCVEESLATTCMEAWSLDGLMVSVMIVDRVFLDRPTTAAVLADVVRDVIETLVANATDLADPLASIEDQAVDSAATGLDALIDDGQATGECPAIDAAAVEAALPGEDALDGWEMAIGTVDAEAVLSCTGTTGGVDVTLKLIAFDEAAAAEDFVASVGLPDGGSAADLPPGMLTVGSCIDAGAEGRFCTEWWWRNGFVVGVWLLGDDIDGDDTTSMLVEIVPTVVETLVEG